jgi:hypothetical protein
MKKVFFLLKSIILCNLLMMSFNVSAQVEEEYEEVFNLITPIEVPSCNTPYLLTSTVVRYKEDADAYVEFNNETEREVTFYLKSGEGRRGENYTTRGKFLVLQKLDLNQTYSIIALNDCKEEVEVGNVITTPKDNSTIDVSKKVFEALQDLVSEGQRNTTFNFINERTDLNEIEKLGFIQEYFYEGESLVRGSTSEMPPPTEGCNCKVIRHNQSLSIGGGSNSPQVSNSQQIFDKETKVWSTTSYNGAAKYMQAWSQGKRTHSKSLFVGSKGGSISPTYFTMEYNWLCTNASGHPSADCAGLCSKDINFTARYDTKLTAATSTSGSCLGCGSRGADAVAEDGAIFVIGDQKGGVKVIADAGQVAASSTCGKIINPDFYISLVDIASTVAKGTIAFSKSDSVGLAALPDLINDILPQIKTLIGTPPSFPRGNCELSEKTDALIESKGTYSLTPNSPTYFRLYSFGNVRASGFTKWNSDARILSDGNLGGVFPGGKLDDKTCCTDEIGNWVIASHPGAIMELPSVKQDMSNFMNLHGILYNQTEVGAVVKNKCKK